MTRRGLLAASLLAPFTAIHSYADIALQKKAPKRNILSIGLHSSEMKSVEVPDTVTYALSVTLETGADAVRIAFGNIGRSNYRILSSIACETTGWQTTGSSNWTQLNFNGKPSVEVMYDPNSESPSVHWSDWVDIETTSPERPQLLFRVALPPQTLPLTLAAGPGDFRNFGIASGPRTFLQSVAKGDFASERRDEWPDSVNTPYSPIFAIQYRARRPGTQIVIGGDSHLSTWHNFVTLASLELSTPERPISLWNTSWGGQPSRRFLPIFDTAIADANPSIVVAQCWTANDGMNRTVDETYLGNIRSRFGRIRREGCVTIGLKGLPRHLFGSDELQSWLAINKSVTVVDGVTDVVFDPNPIVEDQTLPGNWAHGYSNDEIHPNLYGDQALKRSFMELLRSCI